jgi:hypothetical protein
MAARYAADSEVGRLRRVIVHRPELSLMRLTPDNNDELLYDDVLWVRASAPMVVVAERDHLEAEGTPGAMEGFSIVAALATAVQAAALIALHVLPTGYDPVRDAVSDYGIGSYRGWFWLQAVAGGVGCIALAIALALLHPFTPTQAVVALIVAGVARFLIPFFATDQHGSRFQTAHGAVHMILAVIAFGGLVWAATALWSTLSHYPAWQGVEGALTIIPWIMLGTVIAVVLAIRGPRLKPFFGIFERLFYLSSITWVLIVAIDLARISG